MAAGTAVEAALAAESAAATGESAAAARRSDAGSEQPWRAEQSAGEAGGSRRHGSQREPLFQAVCVPVAGHGGAVQSVDEAAAADGAADAAVARRPAEAAGRSAAALG